MTSTTSLQPEDLRDRMVEHIKDAGHLHSSSVEQALRTVPRHLFVSEASVEDAYTNRAITTKPGGPGGRPASCASVPTVVGMMLGQLDAQPGDHVLEIGAGTGYNAALLAELVGDTGQVTTIDIYPDVTEQARRALDVTGYDHVQVVTGDGALGDPDNAPYNKIIGPAGAQLAERLCEQIRAWDRDRAAQPTITAYPAATPNHELAGRLVIDKRFIRLVVSVL